MAKKTVTHFNSLAKHHAVDFLKILMIVWMVTLMVQTSLGWLGEYQTKIGIKKLEKLTFEDFAVYHSIDPMRKIVGKGAEAWWSSDSEYIRPPFDITWTEKIRCDLTPFDGIDQYGLYQEVVTTSAKVREVKPRKLINRGSFASRDRLGNIIRYPNYPTNCLLDSQMKIKHPLGPEFEMHMKSHVVEIR